MGECRYFGQNHNIVPVAMFTADVSNSQTGWHGSKFDQYSIEQPIIAGLEFKRLVGKTIPS